MIENSIKDLVHISHAVGDNPAYVQGGGGNTSIKLDDHRMAIKASGGLLKDMSKKKGCSIVDYTAIRHYLKTPDGDENVFTQKIKSFVVETNNRPSIETGFHAQLGHCVVHTHSVYANILTCSKEGKDIAYTLFPDALWVDYATPGRELTLAIYVALKKVSKTPTLVFLQNHGVIAAGHNAQDALNRHEMVNEEIQKHFNLSLVKYHDHPVDMDFIKNHVLFPDQVVYTLAGDDMLKTIAAKETLWAYDVILKTIEKLALTPRFITKDKIEVLKNMESEKFRQKALKK